MVFFFVLLRIMTTLEDAELWKQGGGVESDLTEEIKRASNEEIENRRKLLENEIKVSLWITGIDSFHWI